MFNDRFHIAIKEHTALNVEGDAETDQHPDRDRRDALPVGTQQA